jgi:glycosyltransferase involved in cell wall biosynthesis
MISVIIPVHNGRSTIGICLQSLFSSSYQPFEVIVVDDFSADGSADIVRQFPCRLVSLDRHRGAAGARNAGARESRGDILFFIDADCVIQETTLAHVADAYRKNPDCVIGGSYAPVAHDDSFYSTFQAVFINYSELKNEAPDYIASHAMVIGRKVFEKSGGFAEDFMPILEDVEFSHRLKRAGVTLMMDRGILVRHIFNYDLKRSCRNALKKARYWTSYSLENRDLMQDSGTASRELKLNVLSACVLSCLLLLFVASREVVFLLPLAVIAGMNLAVSRKLVTAFFTAKGWSFGLRATLYYCLVYPWPVIAGGMSGMLWYFGSRRTAA